MPGQRQRHLWEHLEAQRDPLPQLSAALGGSPLEGVGQRARITCRAVARSDCRTTTKGFGVFAACLLLRQCNAREERLGRLPTGDFPKKSWFVVAPGCNLF